MEPLPCPNNPCVPMLQEIQFKWMKFIDFIMLITLACLFILHMSGEKPWAVMDHTRAIKH